MKKFLGIALALALIVILIAPISTMATNSASQQASTINITAVEIRAQDYTSNVSSITFPAAWPDSTVSDPHNNVNDKSPQSLGDPSLPVVTLVNTNASNPVHIYCNISAWSPEVVQREYYLINDKGVACPDEDSISNEVTFGADFDTGATLNASGDPDGSKNDLYLKVVLGDTSGLTGTSDISILSEPYTN